MIILLKITIITCATDSNGILIYGIYKCYVVKIHNNDRIFVK